MKYQSWKHDEVEDYLIQEWSGTYWDDISYLNDDFQLFHILEGNGEMLIENRLIELSEGDILFVHSQQAHKGKPDKTNGWTVRNIALKEKLVKELLDDTESDNIKIRRSGKLSNTDEINNSLTAIAIETKEKSEKQIINNLLQELLNNLIGEHLFEYKDFEAVERAKNYIKENFKESISIDEIAKNVFVSKFHLIRQFKQNVGLTPHQFQIQTKLNSARTKLLNGEPLSQVAFELGFADDAHFIRTFKKYSDYSPKKYQKQFSNFLQFFDYS